MKTQVVKLVKSFPGLWSFGVEAQRLTLAAQARLFKPRAYTLGYQPSSPAAPSFDRLTTQLVTTEQFFHPRFRAWCKEIRSQLRFNRKTWEFVFILEALRQNGMLEPGRRGLGFGCGEEPLPAAMINRGATVVASDQGLESAQAQGWASTAQHASALSKLNALDLVPMDEFARNCSLREVDMNRIPEDLRRGGFDYTWSACAFEHLGSIEHGLQFILNAMECLKPGGIAVHTTEFNLSSNDATMETPTCVIFRKRDIEELGRRLTAAGHEVFAFNDHPGTQNLDRHVDLPPYAGSPCMKIQLDRYVATSIGLIVRKGPRSG